MELTACMLQLEKRESELFKYVFFGIISNWIQYSSFVLCSKQQKSQLVDRFIGQPLNSIMKNNATQNCDATLSYSASAGTIDCLDLVVYLFFFIILKMYCFSLGVFSFYYYFLKFFLSKTVPLSIYSFFSCFLQLFVILQFFLNIS